MAVAYAEPSNMRLGIGFKREGLLRECILANGKYESIYLYSLLRNEYEEHLNFLQSGVKK